MSDLNQLEKAVMEKLLAGEAEALSILREQLKRARVGDRQFTGVGFYTNFVIDDPKVVRLGKDKSVVFGDVVGHVAKTRGLGFSLVLKDGYIYQLEGFTYGGEAWPSNISDLTLNYASKQRQFGPLGTQLRGSSQP